jgi:4-cresol dehydrogenase (hydroxylating)
MESFSLAIKAWKKILGESFVTTEAAELAKCEQGTFATTQKVLAILHPANSDEVRDCVEVANKFKTPLYPLSRGRNCGYGSRVPYQDQSVIIDLSRLDRILEYDEELAFVRVEPGVTQQQLYDFLKIKGSKHWMDPINTFTDCSVLGNILERGHGRTPYNDRVAYACDFEVVLPTGRMIQTGYSSAPGCKLASLDRWAPGPNLDGLFSQSNFGIVTKVTVWLMPAPEYVREVAFSLPTQAAFAKAIDSLRPLKMDGTIRFGPRFDNEYRLIESYLHYPWEKMNGETPLSKECVADMQRQLNAPLWSGVIGLYGSRAQVAADELKVLNVLENFAENILLIDNETLKKTALADKSVFQKHVESQYSGMTGNVGPVPQRPRWRKKVRTLNETADWSQERCGIMWCPISVPCRGKDALAAIEIFRSVVSKYGFEPDMSVSSIRDRTLEISGSIVFDREDISQDERVLTCAKELMRQITEAGYFPHRLNISTMPTLEILAPELRETLADLSKVLDPNQILAPGRYVLNQIK